MEQSQGEQNNVSSDSSKKMKQEDKANLQLQQIQLIDSKQQSQDGQPLSGEIKQTSLNDSDIFAFQNEDYNEYQVDEDIKSQIVETSPKRRFIRFNEQIGEGSFKTVFKGYDNDSGKEVAWNVIKLSRLPPKERKRISEEISLLKNLKHQNLINFISAWYNKSKEEVVFIVEMSSSSLKKYLKKIRQPRVKVIKNWCREILQGLNYLHTQKPYPIIHRDIKCENIFINTNTGEIRIGDLGLATIIKQDFTFSVLGTPEFMAPEIYEEKYNTLSDIYAFGMSVLEMATLQTPYRECQNPAQIYKKVMAGIKPQSLDMILNLDLKEFINKCLQLVQNRPTAEILLNDQFLKEEKEDDNLPVTLKMTPLLQIVEESFEGTLHSQAQISKLQDIQQKQQKPQLEQHKTNNSNAQQKDQSPLIHSTMHEGEEGTTYSQAISGNSNDEQSNIFRIPLIAEMVTPMKNNGLEVNYDLIQSLLNQILQLKVGVALIGGKIGESIVITKKEKKKLIQTWIEEKNKISNGKDLQIWPVIAINEFQSMVQFLSANQINTVVGSLSNFYKCITSQELAMYIKFQCQLLNENMQYFYYHIQQSINYKIFDLLQAIEEMGGIPNFKGIIFNDYNLHDFQKCTYNFNNKYTMIFAKEELMYQALISGAKGISGQIFQYTTFLALQIMDSYCINDVKACVQNQIQISKLIDIIQNFGENQSSKLILQFLGIQVGDLRMPQQSLNQNQRELLKIECEKLNWLLYGPKQQTL